MNLAIIPARGGSKRIPRKNIKSFAGQPMISYAIAAALKSSLFEHVVVSTDDDEIADVARMLGAEAPFVRPAELADDHTATVPVICHAIQACRDIGFSFDHVCCIYPSVPFLQAQDLVGALALLKSVQTDYCFPVAEFPAAVQRALSRAEDGRMSPFYPEYELTRTQDLESAYYDAGQFYWARADTWLTNPHVHSGGRGYLMPSWRVVDIDTPDDWERAERMRAAIPQGGKLDVNGR